MGYKCIKCNHVYRDQTDFKRHISRKRPCVASSKYISHDALESDHSILSSKTEDVYLCSYCNHPFSSKWNLSRHIDKSCKQKKQQEEEKEAIFKDLVNEVKELKDKVDRQHKLLTKYKSGTTNIHNTNNGTINQYNIIAFGKEDMSHISNREWFKIINKQYKSIEDLVVKTHFDKNKPENHNIYISNMKSKYIMVHDGKNWCIKDKRDTIDELYDEKAYIILNKVDELKERSKLPFKIVDKYNEIKTGYDEEKIRAALIKDIELVLYNKRDIPIYTKRLVDDT